MSVLKSFAKRMIAGTLHDTPVPNKHRKTGACLNEGGKEDQGLMVVMEPSCSSFMMAEGAAGVASSCRQFTT